MLVVDSGAIISPWLSVHGHRVLDLGGHCELQHVQHVHVSPAADIHVKLSSHNQSIKKASE